MARPLELSVAAGNRASTPFNEYNWRTAAYEALRRTFGFAQFRGHQLEAILAALQGLDSFVIMPTGGGKSLCYALLPAIRPGVVLVVSPLVALMQDQVQSLRNRSLRADYLSSTRSEAERRRITADLQQRTPRLQLLYVTPEMLATPAFMQCLRGAYVAGGLQLVAVDEAHCVSSMGHDFRPTYRRLCAVRDELPRVPIMALTATASQPVQADVVRQLRLRDPLMLRTPFNRSNIRYEVRYLDLLHDPEGQPLLSPLPDIVALLLGSASACCGTTRGGSSDSQPHGLERQQQQGLEPPCPAGEVPCSIIYCHRRQTCDSVAAALQGAGIPAAAYHAALPDATRRGVLQDWQAGRVLVVAATVAFGMGIDRAGVRYVFHYSLPGSLEAYYQEAGRAGRDGAPAHSIVYYSRDDRQRREFVLRKEGSRQQHQGGRGDSGGGGAGNQLQQFSQVVQYCLSPSCRRAQVLRHFGEQPPRRRAGALAAASCCDVCADTAAVGTALRELAGAEAQRRQLHFDGTKRVLGTGGAADKGDVCSGGGKADLEFERSWAPEGLDYEHGKIPAPAAPPHHQPASCICDVLPCAW